MENGNRKKQNITLTKHAIERAKQRIIKREDIEKKVKDDIEQNFHLRKPGTHPAKWELSTNLAKYKIAEDLSVITVLKPH